MHDRAILNIAENPHDATVHSNAYDINYISHSGNSIATAVPFVACISLPQACGPTWVHMKWVGIVFVSEPFAHPNGLSGDMGMRKTLIFAGSE